MNTQHDSEPIRVGAMWTICDKCGEEYNTSSIHECAQPQRSKIPDTVDSPMDWDAKITNPQRSDSCGDPGHTCEICRGAIIKCHDPYVHGELSQHSEKNPSTQDGLNFAPSAIDRGYPQRSEQEELRRCLSALRLEVPVSVVDDVERIVNAALTAEREKSAVLESQVENNDATLAQVKLCHKSQLTAERQRCEQAEVWLEEKRNESAMFQQDCSKYYNRLLSALAAIEGVVQASENIGSVGLADAIEICRRRDLSALHKHDAEVRKPLMDLLQQARSYVAKPIPHFSTPSTSALLLLERIDALAKVKDQQ